MIDDICAVIIEFNTCESLKSGNLESLEVYRNEFLVTNETLLEESTAASDKIIDVVSERKDFKRDSMLRIPVDPSTLNQQRL